MNYLKTFASTKKLENICVKAAKAGGAITKKYFQKTYFTRFKKPTRDQSSIVTQADLHAEKEIRKIIRANFPSHSIVGEEFGGSDDGGFTWYVDPLDGTLSFSRGWAIYCTMVGVCFEGKPLAGAIFFPELKRLFHASQENGAFLNEKRIFTSKKQLHGAVVVAEGLNSGQSLRKNFSVVRALSPFVATIRNVGSAGYSHALVAEGKADLFFKYNLQPWDYCAGTILIQEAGGFATDANGENWRVFKKNFIGAANKKILKQVLKLL